MAAYKQQVRQAPAAAAAFLGAVGLLVVEQQSWTIRVHDGVTPGGFRLPTLADLQAGWAQLASPTFTGVPVVPDIADLTTNSSQAVNAKFVQALLPSTNVPTSVDVATTAAADTSGLAYANGTNGVGATLTGANNTAVTIDGITFTTLGQRLLVKNDTQVTGGAAAGSFNGVYVLTQLQAVGVPPVFTRAGNFNAPGNINYTGIVPVKSGTVNGGSRWVPTTVLAANTVGTAAIAFTDTQKVNKVTITPPANGATITITDGKTLTVTNDAFVNQDLRTTAVPIFAGIGGTFSGSGAVNNSFINVLSIGVGGVVNNTSFHVIAWIQGAVGVTASCNVVMTAGTANLQGYTNSGAGLTMNNNGGSGALLINYTGAGTLQYTIERFA